MGVVAKDGRELKTLFRLFRRHSRWASSLALGVLLGLGVLLWWTRPLRSENFVFYLPAGRNVLPIRTVEGTAYLPLVSVLNLAGKVDALRESSNRLRLWYGDKMVEIRDNNKKVNVNKSSFKLSKPVRVVEGQWLVPVEFLGTVLPRIVAEPVEYRPGDNRIFIGGARPATFSVRVEPIPNGARLRVEFSSPLSFQTAARNGKWILYLENRAVEPLEQEYHFDNPYVSGLRFDDQDGVPKLILTPKTSGLDLYPKPEQGGTVLRADIVNPSPAAAVQPAGAPPAQSSTAPSAAAAGPEEAGSQPSLPSVASLPVVVLDAGHGGQDLGAQGENGVVEKNLVAQLVVRVRTALVEARKVRVILTRVGDSDPNFDQRAIVADTAHAAVFISFHAGNLGFRSPRVAVYTYSPSEPPKADALTPRPLFVPWDEAQMLHSDQSLKLAQAIQEQLSRAGGFQAGPVQPAPVRVLRSVDAPAVAVEVGSLAPNVDPAPLLSPDFQRRVSEAIVAALDAFMRRPS